MLPDSTLTSKKPTSLLEPDDAQQRMYDVQSPISRAELDAIADDALGADTPARRLWTYLNDYRKISSWHIRNLCTKAGYPNNTSNSEAYAIAREIFGKLSSRGIARARAFEIYTGWTRERVEHELSRLMRDDDKRVAVKASEISAKCLGMTPTAGGGVQVNVQVNISPTVQGMVSAAMSDDES